MYYLSSQNKSADQLCGYREADLCLCFGICKNPVFPERGSLLIFGLINMSQSMAKNRNFEHQIIDLACRRLFIDQRCQFPKTLSIM